MLGNEREAATSVGGGNIIGVGNESVGKVACDGGTRITSVVEGR